MCIRDSSKIREIVELDEEVKYYRSEFNKKIQEYENTACDVSKSEWLLEKLTDIEKLIVNIKAVGDKRRQLLNTEEARNIAAEQQKTATKDLKQRVSTVRKLIEEHQKQQKREEEMSKHVGTSKIADNSGEFSGPTLGGGGSVTSSRADRSLMLLILYPS